MPDKLGWDMPLVQYGVGAFETMRSEDGRIALWTYHRRRIEKAFERWGCGTEVMDAAEAELRKEAGSGLERVKLLAGMGEKECLTHHIYRNRLELKSDGKSLLAYPPLPAAETAYKSCCYAHHFLAARKARHMGYDDAVYISQDGILLECATAALFLISEKRGIAATGPVLDSVTKRRLLDLDPAFWTEGRLLLKHASSRGRLVYGNAVQGLVEISSISDEKGKELYRSEAGVAGLEQWNSRIFSSHA